VLDSPRVLSSLSRALAWLMRGSWAPPADPEVLTILGEADEARRAGRPDDARKSFRRALERRRNEPTALRGLRDLALEAGSWREALEFAERAVGAGGGSGRDADIQALAAVHYQLGRGELDDGHAAASIAHFRSALRTDREFVPASVALGDALEQMGDHREAIRTWERAVEGRPALPLLARLERAYREEGRPSRMIALYRAAAERVPEDLSIAVGLGRVYLELEMLGEAADQFERIETRAPDHPAVHAYLGAVFERRGEMREACEEYRRALRLADGFTWPLRCAGCSGSAGVWADRCPHCGRWNMLRSSGTR
jgi:tetratricopeptide (TPR) repeat protein